VVESYDFTLIKDNKARTKVIDEFCEIIENGNFSARETMALRNELVINYLQSCSQEEDNENL
jgi:hypothetical protein